MSVLFMLVAGVAIAFTALLLVLALFEPGLRMALAKNAPLIAAVAARQHADLRSLAFKPGHRGQ